jgi:predicted Ser/Thr protein kinase
MPSGDEPRVDITTHYNDGMSLRDYFAGQALGMLRIGDANHARGMAERAYEMADAMLAARTQAGEVSDG